MRFCLIHLDDDGRSDEVAVIVPGAGQVAVIVELDALPALAPVLHEATAGLAEQRCAACATELPGLSRAG